MEFRRFLAALESVMKQAYVGLFDSRLSGSPRNVATLQEDVRNMSSHIAAGNSTQRDSERFAHASTPQTRTQRGTPTACDVQPWWQRRTRMRRTQRQRRGPQQTRNKPSARMLWVPTSM